MKRFLSWDWRTPPGADAVAQVINEFGGGPIYAVAVATGTDDYVVALASHPISAADAQEMWQEHAAG